MISTTPKKCTTSFDDKIFPFYYHVLLIKICKARLPDEASNVDINERCHEVLAVESVHDATVTRDSVGEILKGQMK